MYRERLLTPPKVSFFLFGCRGTGKSTWLQHVFPHAHHVSLLNEGLYLSFLADPELFASELRQLAKGTWVVVDEIQRLPQLLNEVHQAIESHKLKFVLCGSSARKLKKSGVNLLGGRAVSRSLFPYLAQELGSNFNLDKALHVGTLPVIWESLEPVEQLEGYTQMYLKEEIQAEALVRNLPGFVRFLPVAALSHGQAINATNIARDASVARTTVEGYLDILEDTLVAFRLPGYEARLRVKERKLPKLYWNDAGIVNGILKQRQPPTGDLRGRLFEGLVGVTLRASMRYNSDFADEMYYWSPGEAAHTEVDFLLKRGNEFIAIEVKSGPKPRSDWFRGLEAIRDLNGVLRRIVVCPAGRPLRTESGAEVLPFAAFTEELQKATLFP